MNLSAVILTKDNESSIAGCIKSVSFCDEIIIIDDNSIDKTRDIAESLGAKVFIRGLNNNFAAQRNFGLKKAGGSWVLFVDDDERVTNELEIEIQKVTSDPTLGYKGIYLKRRDIIWGKTLKHGENGETRLLRLAKKDTGIWVRKIHEVWQIDGECATLKHYLLHYPHPTLREFIKSVNGMSTLHAQANYDEGKRSNLLKIALWPVLKFTRNYIFRLGFLDGVYGFVAGMTMSFHSFLAWSKLLIMQRKKR